MKVCDYCGKENDDALAFCVGCGTPLKSVEDFQGERKPKILWPPKNWPRILNGTTATIILVVSLAAECGFMFFVFLAGIIVEAAKGAYTPNNATTVVDDLLPIAVVFGSLAFGVTTIWLAASLIPQSLKDTTPTGAAWVRGRWLTIAQGLIVGLAIGLIAYYVDSTLKIRVSHRSLDFFDRMAYRPGLPQIVWIASGLIFAPLFEEILFRGVLYGGYRKSLGPIWALILTTTIFALLHIQAFIQYPPAIPDIIALALAALWWRLHANAIGPAIAAHFAYNGVFTFFVLYRIWR